MGFKTNIEIEWTLVTDAVPKKWGWYIVYQVPRNYKNAKFNEIESWMRSFGICEAWVNVQTIYVTNFDNFKYPEAYPDCCFYSGYGGRYTDKDISKQVICWAPMIKIKNYDDVRNIIPVFTDAWNKWNKERGMR